MPITINSRTIDKGQPIYFIADLAANHGGCLSTAKELIHACAESGVDAVKMQNYSAPTIVSDYGFQQLRGVKTHQDEWKQSVFDSYAAAAIPTDWTEILKSLCDELGLAYLTSPYSPSLVREVSQYVAALKLGSGDITWHEEILEMCAQDKPVLIATGASTMLEVELAMRAALSRTDQVLLMQCNTNYSANNHEPRSATLNRLKCINLRVLQSFARRWPKVTLGLSDHTHGHLTTLAAVGLFDCCAIEKHFTLDSCQQGQDHAFSMTPNEWKSMVDQTSKLQVALKGVVDSSERYAIVRDAVDDTDALDAIMGDGVKRVEDNERDTRVVQRRALRATRLIPAGTAIGPEDLYPLRPCPPEALPPYRMNELIGRTTIREITAGDIIQPCDVQ